jgi:hypothetical protein
VNSERSTDITSVDYTCNVTALEADFWLASPLKHKPNNTGVNYGILIDADFDNTTGFGGIDYKVEISWKNQTEQWNKVLEKWSPYGNTIVVANQTIPYFQFSRGNAGYIILTSDLSMMNSPEKYKMIFYAETLGTDGSYITDFAEWVAVPSPEFAIYPHHKIL